MTTTESSRTRAKREQIMEAARALFLAQGYANTSTDAVTQAAGVSKQTLYAYFPGKAELLAAVVTRELDGLALLGRAGAAPESLLELRDRLLGFARAVTGQLLRPDALALLRLLIGEAVHLPELRGVARGAVPARLLSGVGALLEAAHARNLIHAPELDLSARMLVGPVMSFVALDGWLGDGPPKGPSEATLARLVDLFLLTVTSGGDRV